MGIAEEWLEKAEHDYGLAEDNFGIDHEDAALFFCHQAAEKALKAASLDQTGEFKYSHNLTLLAQELDVPEEFMTAFADLNPFYTGFRYPDEESPEVENPSQIIEDIGGFLEWTRKQLET